MKLHYFKNRDKEIKYFNSNKSIDIPEKYNEKKVRGFWVSTVANIDLPIMTNPIEYKKHLDKIIETAINFNINTIFFQVRPMNDAFYKSELNPYSRFLTGAEGKKPDFDVLEYLIQKAHNKNIKVHAWANPYRISRALTVSKEEYLKSLDGLNFARKNPELVISDEKKQLILNPTKERVKQFIIDSMVEIVTNYDVDGIHWDDYFYPYAPLLKGDDDISDYENRENTELTLADFRRFHVTDVIRRVHIAVHEARENIEFGVSPFGIWQSSKSDPRGSNTDDSTSQSYHTQYADSYNWVKNEYVDYIIPQIYWSFGHKTAPFADLTKWWNDVVQGTNVELYIGHGAYRLGNEGEFENIREVTNQIKYANSYKNVDGNVFFTYKNFNFIEVDKKGMDEIRKLLNNND